MGLARPLFGLAVLSSVLCGELGPRWEPRVEVPTPVDVIIKSYNFNTSVRWNYENRSSKPLFIVEMLCYGKDWTEVSNCVNISQHYCDLTHKIEECSSFWVRVKALNGLHESNYTKPEKFILLRNGTIGPPKLHPSIVGGEILVVIENPRTPYRKKRPLRITANLTDFTYTVFFWENGKKEKRKQFILEECPRQNCSTTLHIPSWDVSHCVSAQGSSEMYGVTGEESKEICITVPPKYSADSTVLIILVAVALPVLMVAFAVTYVCLSKKKIQLPKSLVSVVRSQANSSFDVKPEGKYISEITSLSYKPVLLECEEEKTMERVDVMTEDKVFGLDNSDKEVDTDGLQGTLSKADEINVEEGGAMDVPGSEQDSDDNYSKSIRGQEEMCPTNLPALDLPFVDVQQPRGLEISRNIGGYDKPHWQDTLEKHC